MSPFSAATAQIPKVPWVSYTGFYYCMYLEISLTAYVEPFQLNPAADHQLAWTIKSARVLVSHGLSHWKNKYCLPK